MIPYKLFDWIPGIISYSSFSANPRAIQILEEEPDSINWSQLSTNPAAIHLLEKNLDKINWALLSRNPAAIHLLEKNLDKIDWSELSGNPAAIHLLDKHPDDIIWSILCGNTSPDVSIMFEKYIHKRKYFDWHKLSKNPHAMSIIEFEWQVTNAASWFLKWLCCFSGEIYCKIDWDALCANTNPKAIQMLEENFDKINWKIMSSNPAAIHLIERYPEKIHWSELSSNTAAGAMRLLENHLQHTTRFQYFVNWHHLSKNPQAVPILEKYPEQICWFSISQNPNPAAIPLIKNQCKTNRQIYAYTYWFNLSENPNIFTYDYEKMLQSKLPIHKEIIQNRFHPRNLDKFEGWGFPCDFT